MRRQFLAVAGVVGLAGCGEISSTDESTPASSFPPATDLWHVKPPFPFRFDGEVSVRETSPLGWLLSSVHSKRLTMAGEVLEGGPLKIYFSDEQIDQAQVPTSTKETVTAESTFEETVEYVESGGSIVIDADQRTTVDLQLDIDRF